MKILAIETSCDETALSLVEAGGGLEHPKFKILKNLVTSQIKIHRPYGGVVPNLAKREHLRNLPILFKKIIGDEVKKKSKIKNQKSKISPPLARSCQNAGQIKIKKFLKTIDLVAVTVGPGLEPALWTGINFAKELYKTLLTKPYTLKPNLIGVSHLEGHLYSFLLSQKTVNPKHEARNSKQKSFGFRISDFGFPAIALLVSGGHTILILMKDLIHYKKIGETLDDAAGEAFDKVARLLNLPYPGGPEIEKLAKYGSSTSIDFPRPMLNQKNYNFSFSGLKTAVLYYMRDSNLKPKPQNLKPNIAASFQQAAFDVLIKKTLRAAEDFNAKSIFLTGGVAANKTLQKQFKKAIDNLKLKTQDLKPNLYVTKYPTDNAAMIAAAAYVNYLRKKNRRLIANGNLSL